MSVSKTTLVKKCWFFFFQCYVSCAAENSLSLYQPSLPFAMAFGTAMGVTLSLACVGGLDCGLTAEHQNYIQGAAGQE